jgi:hypothetical protein
MQHRLVPVRYELDLLDERARRAAVAAGGLLDPVALLAAVRALGGRMTPL